jgi:hypothetical protein
MWSGDGSSPAGGGLNRNGRGRAVPAPVFLFMNLLGADQPAVPLKVVLSNQPGQIHDSCLHASTQHLRDKRPSRD